MTNITLDVLAQKVDGLKENVNQRFDTLETNMKRIERASGITMKDHEDRIRKVEEVSASNSTKLGIIAAIQAAFSVFTSGVAGWFGSR